MENKPETETLSHSNTPETMGVTPRYVLLHNAVSKSAHNLSSTAQKLTAMALALLPPDLSSLTAKFSFRQFCDALGETAGGKQYQIFRAAVRECMQCLISIETEPDAKGKKKWEEFTWFTHSSFDEATGKATMKFSTELAEFLRAYTFMYTKISLHDLGRLQSRYAIHIFLMVMSSAFLKGKQGNKANAWYFQASVSDYRFMLGVPKEAYPEMRDFRRFVIEDPVKEINKSGLGFTITPEGIKQGRNLVAVRLTCTSAPPLTKTKRQKAKEAAIPPAECSTIQLKAADAREQKELDRLKERYAEEYAALYAQELAKNNELPFITKDSEIAKLAAAGKAAQILKERHGIVK